MVLVQGYESRTLTCDFTIKNANDVAIVPTSNDKVRAIILHENKTAILTVTSDSATANGSTFTKNSPSSGKNRLRLDALDLAFTPGIYTLIIDFYDDADSEWKNAERHVLNLEDT